MTEGRSPNWRQQIFEEAWRNPEFFHQLLDQRHDPVPVVTEAGIELSSEAEEELRELLAADRMVVEIEWADLERAARLDHDARGWIPVDPPGRGWPLGWIASDR